MQVERRTFEFRSNIVRGEEILHWLKTSGLSGELRVFNEFRAEITFDDSAGAALFKLAWC